MTEPQPRCTDYAQLWREAAHGLPQFSQLVVAQWLECYRAATPWPAGVLEIPLGPLTYLFDAALSESAHDCEDRVVGVFGRPRPTSDKREIARQAGFLPLAHRWSGSGYDRGHFIAHNLGGGLDINLILRAAALNRGHSAAGRRWRALEWCAAACPDALLLVRPIYRDPTGYRDGWSWRW